MMTNVCETCGNGKWTVTHHEAPHRCPVCELVAKLETAERAIEENTELRAAVRDLEVEVAELEAKA
jgi:hypothetical protein